MVRSCYIRDAGPCVSRVRHPLLPWLPRLPPHVLPWHLFITVSEPKNPPHPATCTPIVLGCTSERVPHSSAISTTLVRRCELTGCSSLTSRSRFDVTRTRRSLAHRRCSGTFAGLMQILRPRRHVSGLAHAIYQNRVVDSQRAGRPAFPLTRSAQASAPTVSIEERR